MLVAPEAARLTQSDTLSKTERARATWGLTLVLQAEPILHDRIHMPRVFEYVRNEPLEVARMVSDLDSAITKLNERCRGKKVDPAASHISLLQEVIAYRPLPSLFTPPPLSDVENYMKTYDRTLERMNAQMMNREAVQHVEELPEDVRECDEWIGVHIDAVSEKDIVAGLLMHGYDIFTGEFEEYKDIPPEKILMALCEELALSHRQSALYSTLSDPNGMNWYSSDYFSPVFLSYADYYNSQAIHDITPADVTQALSRQNHERQSAVALRILQLINDNETTQAKLAAGAGLTQTAITGIVKGRSLPKPETLLSICKTFNLQFHEASEIFNLAGYPFPEPFNKRS